MASHARVRVTACIDCATPGKPGVELSWRGLCPDCAIERHANAVRQMAEGRGPIFEQWQRSMLDHARSYLRDHADAT